MRRTFLLAITAIRVLSSPAPLPAQEAARDGVRYSIPEGYVPESYIPEPSARGTALAVLHQPSTGAWLFVAPLPPGIQRSAATARILAHLGEVTVPGRRRLRWREGTIVPASRFEVYHEQRLGSTGKAGVVVEIRHLRFQGRDVLTGYAFPMSELGASYAVTLPLGFGDEPAREDLSRLIGSLLGQAPPLALMPADQQLAALRARGEPEPAEASQIRATYEAFKAALVARDGEAAAKLVTEATLEYYGEMQRLALYGSAQELRVLRRSGQNIVLELRRQVEAEQLRRMSAREVFVFTVTNGWGGRLVEKWVIGRVAVVGDVAAAQFAQQQWSMAMTTFLVRQEDGWRYEPLYALQLLGYGVEGVGRDWSPFSGGPIPKKLLDPLFPPPTPNL